MAQSSGMTERKFRVKLTLKNGCSVMGYLYHMIPNDCERPTAIAIEQFLNVKQPYIGLYPSERNYDNILAIKKSEIATVNVILVKESEKDDVSGTV